MFSSHCLVAQKSPLTLAIQSATFHPISIIFLYAKELDFLSRLNSLSSPQMLFLSLTQTLILPTLSLEESSVFQKLSQMSSLLITILPKFFQLNTEFSASRFPWHIHPEPYLLWYFVTLYLLADLPIRE